MIMPRVVTTTNQNTLLVTQSFAALSLWRNRSSFTPVTVS